MNSSWLADCVNEGGIELVSLYCVKNALPQSDLPLEQRINQFAIDNDFVVSPVFNPDGYRFQAIKHPLTIAWNDYISTLEYELMKEFVREGKEGVLLQAFKAGFKMATGT